MNDLIINFLRLDALFYISLVLVWGARGGARW